MAKISPTEGVGGARTVEASKPRITFRDSEYVTRRPELIEQSGLTQEQVDKLQMAALQSSMALLETAGNMGVLQNADRVETDFSLAKKNTLFFLSRKRNATPIEKGIWEALRDPRTGVPPKDVRGDMSYYIVEN